MQRVILIFSGILITLCHYSTYYVPSDYHDPVIVKMHYSEIITHCKGKNNCQEFSSRCFVLIDKTDWKKNWKKLKKKLSCQSYYEWTDQENDYHSLDAYLYVHISKQYETIYKSKVMSLAYLGRNNNQTPGPAELDRMGGGGRHVLLAKSLPIQVTKFKKHKSLGFQSLFLYSNVLELLKETTAQRWTSGT